MTSRIVVQLSEDPSDSSVPAASFARELVAALVARDDVAVTVLGDARAIAERADVAGIEIVDLATADLPAIAEGADAVVQSHPFQPRPLDLPTVTVVHDLSIYATPWAWGAERAASVRTLHKNLIRAEAVVTPYPALVARLARVEPLTIGKTTLTNSPLLLGAATADHSAIDRVRDQFLLDNAEPTVVCPVAPLPSADTWNLLSAMRELARTGRRARLIAVGSVSDQTWLNDLRRRVAYLGLDGVQFSGDLDPVDLRALLISASAIVVPGVDCGVWAIAEAVAVGQALACASSLGALAQIERLQLTVPTFESGNVDEIVAAVGTALEDGGGIVETYAAARQIVAGWTWDAYATDLLDVVAEATT